VEKTLTTAETARSLGVRLDYIYVLLRGGILSGERQDGQWAVKRSSVEQYRQTRRVRRPKAESAHAGV
jgi:excisionase family DNA binding protein